MKTAIKFSIFIAISIIACKSVKLNPVTDAEVEKARLKFPNTTQTLLQEGQDLYKSNCAKCHALKNPSGRTEKQWNKVLPRMTKRAGVDSVEKMKITQYLLSMTKEKKSKN